MSRCRKRLSSISHPIVRIFGLDGMRDNALRQGIRIRTVYQIFRVSTVDR